MPLDPLGVADVEDCEPDLEFGVRGFEFRVQVRGFRGSKFRVRVLGFGVCGLGV